MSTRLLALALVLVAACAPATSRLIAVADPQVRYVPPPSDGNMNMDVAYCRRVCGFALEPGEQVVACQQVDVSSKLDSLHAPRGVMMVCTLR